LRAFLPRRKGVVGIELGEGWLRLARKPAHRGGRWHALTLEPGEGRAFQEALQNGGVRAGSASLVLTLPAVDVFPLTIPPDQRNDLDSAVLHHADRRLGYPITDASIDYVVLPARFCRQTEGAISVLVYAVERSLLDGVLDALEDAGVEVDVIVTPAFVLAPLIARTEGQRRLVIATSDSAVSIAVIEHGNVLIERVLGWGGRSLVTVVSAALHLTDSESVNLLEMSDEERARVAAQDVLREILAPSYQELVREARSCLDYCASFLHHRDLDAIVVAGSVGSRPGFLAAIEKGLGTRTVSLRDTLSRHEMPDLTEGFTVAAAAALYGGAR
jgi:Tfp pilus assembly PilM family ATPase